jgi:hypothetical protein
LKVAELWLVVEDDLSQVIEGASWALTEAEEEAHLGMLPAAKAADPSVVSTMHDYLQTKALVVFLVDRYFQVLSRTCACRQASEEEIRADRQGWCHYRRGPDRQTHLRAVELE